MKATPLHKNLPLFTSQIIRKLTLIHHMYAKYRNLKDQVTNKQIEYLIINKSIMSACMEPNQQAYLKQYHTILKQSQLANAMLTENQMCIEQCLDLIEEITETIEPRQKNDQQNPDEILDESCQSSEQAIVLDKPKEQEIKVQKQEPLKAPSNQKSLEQINQSETEQKRDNLSISLDFGYNYEITNSKLNSRIKSDFISQQQSSTTRSKFNILDEFSSAL